MYNLTLAIHYTNISPTSKAIQNLATSTIPLTKLVTGIPLHRLAKELGKDSGTPLQPCPSTTAQPVPCGLVG
jgi:hypothetical protein